MVTRLVRFTINYAGIPSENKVYAANKYKVRQLIADEWHEIVKYSIKSQLGEMTLDRFPVHIILRVYPPNRRRDIGNTIAKIIVDGIVKSGLLPDDSLRYVQAETKIYCGVDKINPRIEVWIEDMKDADDGRYG